MLSPRDGVGSVLVTMIASRETTDTEQAYRSYARELTRYATGLVGPFDAADVVSEACLRAFSSYGWGDVENHRAYLYRTVFAVAHDLHRSTLSRRLREMKSAEPETVSDQLLDIDVLEAVSRLSLKQRSAVILTYWGDLPPEEVGVRMGCSSGSVKRHLARARGHLREWLK